jgi:hypothetical protein
MYVSGLLSTPNNVPIFGCCPVVIAPTAATPMLMAFISKITTRLRNGAVEFRPGPVCGSLVFKGIGVKHNGHKQSVRSGESIGYYKVLHDLPNRGSREVSECLAPWSSSCPKIRGLLRRSAMLTAVIGQMWWWSDMVL